MEFVTVSRQETLEALSARTGVPSCMLLRSNGLTPDEVYPGLRMTVPQKDWCETRGVCPLRSPVRTAANSVLVEPGENLWDVARRTAIPPRLLMLENDIDDADSVRPGDALALPDLPEKLTPYIADAVESARDVAERFGTDIRELMWINRLPAATPLYPGQQLVIPA